MEEERAIKWIHLREGFEPQCLQIDKVILFLIFCISMGRGVTFGMETKNIIKQLPSALLQILALLSKKQTQMINHIRPYPFIYSFNQDEQCPSNSFSKQSECSSAAIELAITDEQQVPFIDEIHSDSEEHIARDIESKWCQQKKERSNGLDFLLAETADQNEGLRLRVVELECLLTEATVQIEEMKVQIQKIKKQQKLSSPKRRRHSI